MIFPFYITTYPAIIYTEIIAEYSATFKGINVRDNRVIKVYANTVSDILSHLPLV